MINKDCEDVVGFCGELFADSGDLLSSLSPLLTSMKLFGLYFHREDRRQRSTDDPEWNTATPSAGKASTKLRVYATVVLILVWLNAVRCILVFTRNDSFGAVLLMKIAIFNMCSLVAIFQTSCYYASHSRQLFKVLFTLPVTRDCVRSVHRAAVGLTIFIWISMACFLIFGATIFLYSDEEFNFILAPFVTYICVPKVRMIKMIGYLGYVILFPCIFFSHLLSLVLVYLFYSQFEKLKKNFRRVLGERRHFNGDLSLFRRRHQTLSRAVSKIDGFMRLSNVAGFVCHIVNIILLLYSIIFYRESTKSVITALTYLFWLCANINGLIFSAGAGIIVNHMVRIC